MNTEPTVLLEAAFASYPEAPDAPEGYIRSSAPISNIEGLHVEIYQKKGSNDYIVSFRGTDPALNDLSTDFSLGWPQYHESRSEIQQTLSDLIRGGGRVEITGHSLGGALAQFAAYDLFNNVDDDKRLQILNQVSLTTWNALGGVWGLQRNGGYDPTVMEGVNARHYYRFDDIVARLGRGHVGGETLRLDDPEGDVAGLVAAHNQDEISQSLAAGSVSKATPKYFDLHDFSQIVVAELVLGILKILERGEFIDGVRKIRFAGASLQLGAILFVAEDLGEIVGAIFSLHGQEFAQHRSQEILAVIQKLSRALSDSWYTGAELQMWAIQQQMLLGAESIVGELPAGHCLPGRPELEAYASILNTHLQQLIPPRCPLVLDLAGDGLTTLSLSTANVRFDLDADGMPEACGWIGSNDALLVRDRNANGRIDSGLELFGDHTILANGQRAEHGFAALADLDANRDGQIDARDAAWSELGLWRDANSNGSLESGEWLSLSSQNITALELAFGPGSGLDAQGNDLRLAGHYRRLDGSRRLLADVWLATGATSTLADGMPPLATATASSTDTALSPVPSRWPDIGGMGRVVGLNQALSQDSSGRLQQLLDRWLQADAGERQGLLSEIAFHWSGVADLPSLSASQQLDARIPAALHAFTNDRFLNSSWDLTNERNITVLRESFQGLCRQIGALLEAESLLSPLWGRSIRVDAQGLPQLDPGGFDLALQDQLSRSSSDEQLIAAGQALRSHLLVADVLRRALHDRATQNLHQPDRRLWLMLLPKRLSSASAQGWIWNQDASELIETSGDGSVTNCGGGDDVVLGSHRQDQIITNSGDDLVVSGDGDDHIETSSGNDTICAGRGNDTIAVGRGQGMIVFNPGDGQDRITTTKLPATDPDSSQSFSLHFNGDHNADTIRIRRIQQDLMIRFQASSDQLLLADYFLQPYSWDSSATVNTLRRIVFADGRHWDYRRMMEQAIQSSSGNDNLEGCEFDETISGGSGDDSLNGWGGNDLLSGEAGADILFGSSGDNTLKGGSGNDSFFLLEGTNRMIYNLGDGFDTLHGTSRSAHNELILGPGITPQDLKISRSESDLLLTFQDPSAGFRLSAFFNQNWCHEGDAAIRLIRFHDGQTWSWQTLKDALLRGTPGDDQILGFNNDDTIWGEAGQDGLMGRDGHDLLLGGSGNDTLDGELGNDRLDGGDGDDLLIARSYSGEDTLVGGSGRNLFRHYRGDVILAANPEGSSASSNTLELPLIAPEDVRLERLGNQLRITYQNIGLAGFSSIRVEDFFRDCTVLNRWNPLQFISFGSGKSWDAITLASKFNAILGSSGDNRLSGRDSDDWLDGMEGHDLLQGQAGHDSLQGGSGNDTLNGGPGNDLLLGSDGQDTASWAGQSTAVRVDLNLSGPQDSGAGLDSLDGIEHLQGGSGNDRLLGNDGANRLDGGDGDDWLDGGGGNDTLNGGNQLSGGDTASYARAGAAVQLNLSLTAAQNTGGAGSDQLSGVEHLIGSSHGDGLIGSSAANRLEGGGGNDTLQGGAGADSLVGGADSDLFVYATPAEAGNGSGSRDWILDFSAEDRLDLSGIDARSDQTGNQAFVWIGGAAFSGLGQLRYTRLSNGNGLLEGNCSGNLAADLQLELSGAPDLAGGALVLL